MRPAWLIRFGLFLYDHLGGRELLPASRSVDLRSGDLGLPLDRRFTRGFEYSDCRVDDARLVALRSEEHTSELQSLMRISYAVFCLKKKKDINYHTQQNTLICM